LIPKECKRLAEVDFPVAEVSRHSAREKSIRHGHPSTLHLWWARRPLAACRAMLMALLLPDPCDVNCPGEFRGEARRLLNPMPNCGATGSNKELRDALLKFIADFANWDNSAKPAYLECARGLVKAAHGEEPPLVVDPFAGGGSIPLEALRIGCDAFASDLNPVACLILKVLLEDIPRFGPKLAEELRTVGKQIKEEAEKELAEFYPPDPDGARPIAYLWARTVRCESTLREAKSETEESVSCGAEIPLMRSFWLCKKAKRRRALRLVQERHPKNAKDPLNTLVNPERGLRFEIFEPESEGDVCGGTVSRARAVCPLCGKPLAPDRVRAQLSAQRGGADAIFDAKAGRIGGARLLAVVSLDENKSGRQYRLPTERDYEAVWKAQKRLEKVLERWVRDGRKGLCPVPDERIPLMSGTFNAPIYGMNAWGDLFSSRQKLSLLNLARLIAACGCPSAVRDLLAITLDRVSSRSSSLCLWRYDADQEKVEHVFGRQALPMVWDFAESVGLSASTGSFEDGLGVVSLCVEFAATKSAKVGQTSQGDARVPQLPHDSCGVWLTDPPYYFAVPYADLSDFFFVWLKRTLPQTAFRPDSIDPHNPLTPKEQELCEMSHWDQERYKHKDKAFFENGMRSAFSVGRNTLREEGIGCVVFAHKTTEGWEALISGMLRGGWTVTGSWPITTEMANRLRARESAALAASVHLVCRPRPENAGIGGWEDILRELPSRIGDWMERLSGEGIRGADLVFSCIGPALELFSKYDRVETAEGREVKLDEFLAKVWEVVGRTALQQILGTAEARARNSAAGALEEDARLTALFLWTLQSTNGTVESRESKVESKDEEEGVEEEEESDGKPKKGYVLIYDVARRFAQPLGIHLENWEGRIIETKKGVVRLVPVLERAEQLFGQAGTEAVAQAIERSQGESPQFALFPDEERVPGTPIKTRKAGRGRSAGLQAGSGGAGLKPGATQPREATTLDRVHAAMLLQAGGQATALRAMLEAETQRSPDFLRLANALSALYPKESEEKRLLDAMLLAVPR